MSQLLGSAEIQLPDIQLLRPYRMFMPSMPVHAYGIRRFGTPHHSSSKGHLFVTLQRIVRLAVTSCIAQASVNLVHVLEEHSETLQDIHDQVSPLIFWLGIYVSRGFTVRYSSVMVTPSHVGLSWITTACASLAVTVSKVSALQ
ncbi:uncharacterized protein LDX57_001958 [Aspergillus melleus]|uniref:uncharacterized protein n=1 Tax=Aspergillus melleus TaxID=138277 RepID=UPI001E8E0FBB|nr:uncharacterized protein LDX57_001958 [Aspergillus melleus]KAH8424201.1 hypothetical protein LDX57_001958 [Aspergillus melleus]